MNYLSNPLQALQRCEGINTSFIYLGSYGSSFEWHAEDVSRPDTAFAEYSCYRTQ